MPRLAQATTDVPAPVRSHLRHFADCMADVQGAQVYRYLSLPPSSEANKLAREMINDHPRCLNMNGTTVIHGEAFRGSLANAMLRRRPALLDTVAAKPASGPRRVPTGLGDVAFMSAFATCLVDAEPAKAVAVIRTTEMSEEERAAIMSLGEGMKGCIASDTAYHLNYGDLRTFLATAIFNSAAAGALGNRS